MIIRFCLLLISCLVLLFSACDRRAGNDLTRRLVAEAQAQNTPKEFFYGRVLDQHGNPVPNAKIKTSGYYPDGFGAAPLYLGGFTNYIQADENGLFLMESKKMTLFYINDIICHGYENTNPTKAFDYTGVHYAKFTPDRNNPVIFTVRKREHEMDFLLRKTNTGNPIKFEKINTAYINMVKYFRWESNPKDDRDVKDIRIVQVSRSAAVESVRPRLSINYFRFHIVLSSRLRPGNRTPTKGMEHGSRMYPRCPENQPPERCGL